MKTHVSLILAFSLLSSSLQVTAASRPFDPILNQYLIDRVLDETFSITKKIKNRADAEDTLAAHYAGSDLKKLQQQLKPVKKFPKLQRLNRGFAYDYGGKHFTFVIEDIGNMRFTVNNNVKWTYDSRSPLNLQLEILSRGIEKQNVSFFNPLFKSAHADGGATIIIGILIASIVVPILTDVTNSYVLPKYKSWYCEDKDPNAFATFKYCQEYFTHQATTRPKVPDAKPVAETHQPEIFTMEKKCSKTNDPDFWVQFEGESGITIRRTIKYDENKKPKQMIEEQIKPSGGLAKVFILKGDGELLKVTDGKSLFLSRDKDDAESMNPDKFEEMKAYDKAIETTIGFIKTCDETIASDLTLKAAQAGGEPVPEAKSGKPNPRKELTTIPQSNVTR